MRTRFCFLITFCSFLFLFNCNDSESDVVEKSINIGTHNLNYYSIGNSSPTIVLDVGLGGSFRDWLPLLETIAQKNRILCYDRAGYGRSEIGPFPRCCERSADELYSLLKKAQIKGPYILVGHSLGAQNIQSFAHKYKEDVSGILLLDPPPLDWVSGNGFPELTLMAENQTAEFRQMGELYRNSGNEGQREQADFLLTLASEHEEMFSSSYKYLNEVKSFEEIPLTVIASGIPNPAFGDNAVAFQHYWNEQCKKLTEKSSYGKYILAVESSHHIHRDNPEIVESELNNLISKSH